VGVPPRATDVRLTAHSSCLHSDVRGKTAERHRRMAEIAPTTPAAATRSIIVVGTFLNAVPRSLASGTPGARMKGNLNAPDFRHATGMSRASPTRVSVTTRKLTIPSAGECPNPCDSRPASWRLPRVDAPSQKPVSGTPCRQAPRIGAVAHRCADAITDLLGG
jgi:hypothetical protein